MHKRLLILGTRGVPAEYGGFETLAETLALHLVQKGWRVTVYCQEDWNRTVPYETMWGRVRRVHIPVKQQGFLGSMVFAFKAALHARKQPTLALTLGYDHAFFSLLQRFRGKANLFHMGGISYNRPQLGFIAKHWLKLNERLACQFGNHLIVDNPEIATHLSKRTSDYNISTIPNGALAVMDANAGLVREFELEPGKFSTVVGLIRPENSVLEIVQGFSAEPRGHRLVIVGDLDSNDPYHQQVVAAASAEVKFIGAIYDTTTLRALRYYSYLYVHGHQIGGTNPSLVEALGAGNPVIAHDNVFNRWVTGPDSAVFFSDAASCSTCFSQLLAKPDLAMAMKKAARLRHAEHFTWEQILPVYEKLLSQHNPYEPDPEGWEQYMED